MKKQIKMKVSIFWCGKGTWELETLGVWSWDV